MVQAGSVLKVVDNSGAKYAKCLKILGSKKSGGIGDFLVVSILSLRRGKGRKRRVKRKEICLGLLLSSNKKVGRHDGFFFRPFLNSILLFNRSFKPIGNRVFGMISKELRLKQRFKAVALSSSII